MKSYLVVAVAGIVGVGAGVGSTFWEFGSMREAFERPEYAAGPMERGMHPVAYGARKGRIAVVNGEDHDFGTMERETERSHTFELKNEGTEPITLEKGTATCKCTKFEIDKTELQPGEIAKVLVTWKPVSYDLNFHQRAEIKVPGDLERSLIGLTIHGRVVQNIRCDPDSLILGDFPNTDPREYKIRMFSYRLPDLKLLETRYDASETVSFFKVDHEPMPPEELAKEQGATSGVLATVTIKPGLPLGAFRQTIRLVTNETENGVVALIVQGITVSDIALRGPAQFHEDIGLLDLDLIKKAEGAQAEMWITVRGPLRQTITAEVASVDPKEALEITLGERKSLSPNVMAFPLRVKIRDESPFVERLGPKADGYGKVVIRTNHPQASELRFYVRFAVAQ